MKVLLILAVCVFGFWFLVNKGCFPTGRANVDTVMLPVKHAGLLAKAPEEKIQIPVAQSCRFRSPTQADPRGADRLHQARISLPRVVQIYSAKRLYAAFFGERRLAEIGFCRRRRGGFIITHIWIDTPSICDRRFVTPETVVGYVGNTGNAKGRRRICILGFIRGAVLSIR